MSILEIIKYPDPRLHEKSSPIEVFDDKLLQTTKDMGETMHSARGIGLAGVQVAIMKQILVIDISDMDEEESDSEERSKKLRSFLPENVETYINPKITKFVGETSYEEGCLSIPGVYGKVKRAESIVLEYNDPEGNLIEEEAEGLRAIVLQHEIDHLNGVLFTDRVGPMQKMMLLKKYKKLQQDKDEGL